MIENPRTSTGISRREFLAGAGRIGVLVSAGVLAAGCVASGQQEARQGHNVLILKSDEHNPRISAAEGHPFARTPNMQRLARMGTLYDSCYCPSPLCAPSRSSFMSGRPVHEIQTYNNSMVVPHPAYPSYGKVLNEQGVETVHVGKVDAYRPPEKLGFAEMLGTDFRGRGDTYISRDPLAVRNDADKRAQGYGVKDTKQEAFGRDVESMAEALRFLDSRAPKLARPWTMEINLNAPHFPHHVTQELWDMYASDADLPEYGEETESARHQYARDLRRHFGTDAMEPVIREHRRGYFGRVTWVDRQLGRLLDALETNGLMERTSVVYTSDHGEMLGKFGMWWKGSMYEDSLRVPLIAAGPGFDQGVRTSTPVTQWDLQASLFEATGANRPENWMGEPLQHVSADDPERTAFAEYHGHGTRASAFAVRQGPWKYIHNANAPDQLYDLQSDPDETRNLAETDKVKVAQMERALREYCDPEREHVRAKRFIRHQLDAVGCEDRLNGCPAE